MQFVNMFTTHKVLGVNEEIQKLRFLW